MCKLFKIARTITRKMPSSFLLAYSPAFDSALAAGEDGDNMPGWMQTLHSIAGSANTAAYLRLFLVKMVIHIDRRHADRVASQPEVRHVPADLNLAFA